MITDKNILILSTQDWDALPTRKHHWANMFAKQGNRVLYVEQQMHLLGWIVDIRNQYKRLFQWLTGPRIVQDNLWVFTLPIVLPFFQVFTKINALNNWILAPIIVWALRKIGFENIILWLYTPHAVGLIGRLNESFVVYECVDDFTETRGLINSKTIRFLESKQLNMVDQVIVTHPNLKLEKSEWCDSLAVIPNGADLSIFSVIPEDTITVSSEIVDLPRPIIGFHGWIQYWIDFELIKHAARQHPEWTFVFVGPIEPLARVDLVRNLDNVHFIGKRPYMEIPHFVAGFDVCINPFKLDKLSDSVSPIKLYEYIASGKPIVSVDMPAAREFEQLVSLSRTPQEFVDAITDHLASKNQGDAFTEAEVEMRQKFLKEFSWDARFNQVEDVICSNSAFNRHI